MGLKDLPLASGQAHRKTFEAFGWTTRRNAGHIIMTHLAHRGVTLSVPNHKEVRRGTLQSLVRAAKLTDRQYREMFESI